MIKHCKLCYPRFVSTWYTYTLQHYGVTYHCVYSKTTEISQAAWLAVWRRGATLQDLSPRSGVDCILYARDRCRGKLNRKNFIDLGLHQLYNCMCTVWDVNYPRRVKFSLCLVLAIGKISVIFKPFAASFDSNLNFRR